MADEGRGIIETKTEKGLLVQVIRSLYRYRLSGVQLSSSVSRGVCCHPPSSDLEVGVHCQDAPWDSRLDTVGA